MDSELIPILEMTDSELGELFFKRKLSLSKFDLRVIKDYFREIKRNPTELEIEVIAQTWSEHCKHRIFNGRILHNENNKMKVIDGIFKTYIKGVTEKIIKERDGFVLCAFEDNAGFIKLDDELSVCFKVETHNHPSAIEPYAGANTGIGGVIRDILGAGRGAKPGACIDVFCFGPPDCDIANIEEGVIHPQSILRGVVKGVRDYGNRMGIPTLCGAIHFNKVYTYNPLVYCGSAGIIPIKDIKKEVYKGLSIVLVGGKTGRDGLRGATFSSASLREDSRTEDIVAVQIGNPIEEKKILDFVLKAREKGLIEYITDCGGGGLSSACGEMLKTTGGKIYLEKVPLKEPGMKSWEIFLSESQERMVLAVKDENLKELSYLTTIYDIDCTEIGEITDTKRLEVYYFNNKVCDLESEFLHNPPYKVLVSHYRDNNLKAEITSNYNENEISNLFKRVLADINIVSREPVIREYDFEVQGNTVVKPLIGGLGDMPQDGVAIRVDGSKKYIGLGCSILPSYALIDPYNMGLSTLDEAVRQIIVTGVNPEKIALLDNFCIGNPDDSYELGRLVKCAEAISYVALCYKTPFISGKDSFYNYYISENGIQSIPVSLLISSIGIIDDKSDITTSNIKSGNSLLCIVGYTKKELGGSIYYKILDINGGRVPGLDPQLALKIYQQFYKCIKDRLILASHDVSEGGVIVALTEMGFGINCGIEIDVDRIIKEEDMSISELLFSESNSRIVFEIEESNLFKIKEHFKDLPFTVIGKSVNNHRKIIIKNKNNIVVEESLEELKNIWKKGLEVYY
ncbi:MAG: phosphoribosylformylglycinamidine synthase subunit PurL [Candidatus Hydrogenedentota bacterium]